MLIDVDMPMVVGSLTFVGIVIFPLVIIIGKFIASTLLSDDKQILTVYLLLLFAIESFRVATFTY